MKHNFWVHIMKIKRYRTTKFYLEILPILFILLHLKLSFTGEKE